MKLTPLCLALASIPAWGQVAPVPAPDPGPPVTTMRPGFLYINPNTLPKRRLGESTERIDSDKPDGPSYTPGCWPGWDFGKVGTSAECGGGSRGRNSGAQRIFAARSHFAWDDPIVYPGQKGKSHLHVFFGNTLTSGLSTALSIRTTGNSTAAGGTVNRSGYWVPALIEVCDTLDKMNGIGVAGGYTCDWRDNGKVWDPNPIAIPLPDDPGGLNVYYKPYFAVGEWDAGVLGAGPISVSWSPNHDTQPLPTAFRMIAGDPNRTTQPTSGKVRFSCRVSEASEPTTAYIPGTGQSDVGSAAALTACSGTNHLIQIVTFPACWNGVDLDSPSHNAHITYEEQDTRPGANTGDFRCPVGFTGAAPPNDGPFPGVEFKLHYIIPAAKWPFLRLSSDHYSTDLRAGFSNHGDWFNGWKPEVMLEWVKNCNRRGVDCHDNILGPATAPNDETVLTGPWRALHPPRYDR